MTKQADLLAAPFPEKDLKTRPGRAGMTFTYVDSRAVQKRLDDVLGVTGWEWRVEIADVATKTVKGILTAVIDGVATVREDFGVPNSDQSEEPFKESSTDALRRCGSLLSIGRYLYANGGQTSLSVAPRAVSVDSVRHSQPSVLSTDVAVAAAMLFAEGECPDHRTAWSFKPAGVSKAGKEYSGFFACSGKDGGGQFCKRKPSIAWVNAQTAPSGEPERTDTSDLESLPF